MARQRRTLNVFGLSFLDVMFCGFGAVILLVMIVHARAITHRKEVSKDLRGEVERLEREVLAGELYLTELRASREETGRRSAEAAALSAATSEKIALTRAELESVLDDTQARVDSLAKLQADLKRLDEEKRQAAAEVEKREADEAERGKQVRRFAGDGDRQYLTGLKMGGARVLILLDASASMLADTVVNVIVRRNLAEAERRRSPKWQRALATTEWLLARLPATSQYQVMVFNTEAKPALDGTRGRWLDAGDAKTLDAAIAALRSITPADGTSLHAAFGATASLSPSPDNVFLLTDGLPTQGARPPTQTKVSGEQRMRHFQQSVKRLQSAIPVNVVLFPMEGDPLAASAFWKLAMLTKGSFISPSEDWP